MSAEKLLMAGGLPLPEFVSTSNGSSSSSTTVTVTAPAGIQNGDLLIAYGRAPGGNFRFNALAPGFSLVWTNGGVDFIATKTAANESGNYTFTGSNSAGYTVVMLVYRNARQVNTLGELGIADDMSGFTLPAITPTFRGVLCALSRGGTITSGPSGMTLRVNNVSSTYKIYLYDQSPQEASSSGTRSVTFNAASIAAGFLFQITNEKPVAPEFIASAQTQRTTSGSSLTIDKPSGTEEGDLMVAVMATPVNSTWTGASEWTEVADQGSSPSLRIAYKVAGASEGASYTFTSSASSTSSGCILTYRYAAYDTIASSFTGASSGIVQPSQIAPTQSQSVLLACVATPSASVTATFLNLPMNSKATDGDGTGPSYLVADKLAAKTNSGFHRFTISGAAVGIMLALKPTRSIV
jgi:hypothetical protein